MILFDTSVLSRIFRRRRPDPQEVQLTRAFETLMASDESLGLPGIVLQEVLTGLPSERQFQDMRARLEGAFTVVVATAEDHVEAARLRNLCVSKGANVSGIDCLIATISIAGSHQLFAVDQDFDAIREHSALRLFDHRDDP